MDYKFERVKKTTTELYDLIYSKKHKIENYQMKDGHYLTIEDAYQTKKEWKNLHYGDYWGERDSNHWFKTNVKVPAEFNGKTIALVISTRENGWDAVNPQFILYLNDKLVQGLDVNHTEVIIDREARAEQEYKIDLHAYSGTIGDHGKDDFKTRLFIDLVTVDEHTRDLYYNIHVPWLVIEKLDKDDKTRIDTLRILNETINLIDLRKPFSDSYYQSINKANEYIQNEYYQKMTGKIAEHAEVIATCIGHTHIDVAWWWTVAQTRQKVSRSFATVLNLMQQYPEYLFMSSQPQLYQFLKEDQPQLYAKIKEKITEGRWEPEGSMWVEADTNVTSGESLVRQLLFGKRFFKEEFGVENDILWLPDVFGYSAALPQILKKSDINYFMTTKISWNQINKLPVDTFLWQGIDGSQIFTHFITTKGPYQEKGDHFTTYNGDIHPGAIKGAWDRYQQKEINNEILISYGYGDGGGGPTKNMLEIGRRMEKGLPGAPRVQQGKARDFFNRIAQRTESSKKLPQWIGELYLEYHRGTYTSMARNKRSNRKNELLYRDAELLSSLALISGIEYQQEKINQGWQTILLNQFHDILPGSSIKEVYDVTKKEYAEVEKNGYEILNKAIDQLSVRINIPELSIIIFNTLPFTRTDLVKIPYTAEMDNMIILDDNNNPLPVQIIKENNKKYYTFLAPNIPALGYKTYKIKKDKINNQHNIQITTKNIETPFYKINLDEQGLFTSIYDKRNNRELLKENQKGNLLIAYEDKPMNFDNWDIDNYYTEKKWEITDLESIEVIENGNIRSCLEIKRKFCDSLIIQKIYFYEQLERIDFDTYIDWKEQQILLKVEFPVDIHTNKATYDIQFGNLERPTHQNTSWDKARFEVCGHKWADVSEEGYGVSLLNDCKYGYDIFNSNLRLTLLKSGIEPNPTTDQEEHFFTYSLYPHTDNWKHGNTIQQANSLNTPLYAKISDKNKGIMENNFSLVECKENNIIIETIKKAEDSNELIIRLYEAHNKRTTVNLKFSQDIRNITETNLMERELEKLTSEKNTLTLEVKPYEIKTIKVDFIQNN